MGGSRDMKIVFFGTPDYVLPILERLAKEYKEKADDDPIVAVVTQEPKVAGRKKLLTYSPIDTWAHKRNVPIFFNPKDLLTENIHADLGILAAYGKIIPREVINHFLKGIINIHPSLLPKYRGASPIQATILSGETQTGVSFIKMDELLDHGPIISQFKEEVDKTETAGSLRNRLFDKSIDSLIELIPPYLKGKIKLKEQDHEMATFTTQITKSDGFIPFMYIKSCLLGETVQENLDIHFIKNYSFTPNADSIDRFIHAMDPWPGTWTSIRITDQNGKTEERRLKILKAHHENGKLILDTVQLEGRTPSSWDQFKSAYNIDSTSATN